MKSLYSKLPRETIHKIESARIAYLIFMNAFEELEDLKGTFLESEERPSVLKTIKAYQHIWTLIDCGFRFGTLLRAIRGLKYKGSPIEASRFIMGEVRTARNHIQHLPGEILNLPQSFNPIMGAMCFVDDEGTKSVTIALGADTPGAKYPSGAYDSDAGKLVTDSFLHYSAESLNLHEVYRAMLAMNVHLEEWLTSQNLLSIFDAKPTTHTFTTGNTGPDSSPANLSNATFVNREIRSRLHASS